MTYFWPSLRRKKATISRMKLLEKRSKKLVRKSNIIDIYGALVGASVLHGDFETHEIPDEDVEDSIDWMDVYKTSASDDDGNKLNSTASKKKKKYKAITSIKDDIILEANETISGVPEVVPDNNSLESDILAMSIELKMSCNKLAEKYTNQTLWYTKDPIDNGDDFSSDRCSLHRTNTARSSMSLSASPPPSILIRGKKGEQKEKLSSFVFQRIDKILNELPQSENKQLQR